MDSQCTSPRPKRWTDAEDELLRQAMQQCAEGQWKEVCKLIPGRTHTQCMQRWSKVLEPGLVKGSWSIEEDIQLLVLVREQIQMFLAGTRPENCPPSVRLQPSELEAIANQPGVLKKSAERKRKRKSATTREVIVSVYSIVPQALLEQFEGMGMKVRWGEISKYVHGRTPKQCRERWVNNLDPSIKRGPWEFEEDAKLLATMAQFPSKWARIAKHLSGRTENAVKNRVKALQHLATTHGYGDVVANPTMLQALRTHEASRRNRGSKASSASSPSAQAAACSLAGMGENSTHSQSNNNNKRMRYTAVKHEGAEWMPDAVGYAAPAAAGGPAPPMSLARGQSFSFLDPPATIAPILSAPSTTTFSQSAASSHGFMDRQAFAPACSAATASAAAAVGAGASASAAGATAFTTAFFDDSWLTSMVGNNFCFAERPRVPSVSSSSSSDADETSLDEIFTSSDDESVDAAATDEWGLPFDLFDDMP